MRNCMRCIKLEKFAFLKADFLALTNNLMGDNRFDCHRHKRWEARLIADAVYLKRPIYWPERNEA